MFSLVLTRLFILYEGLIKFVIHALSSAADGIGSLGSEQSHISVPMADPGAWATAMNNLGIVPMSLTGQQLVSGKAHHLFTILLFLLFNSSPLCCGFEW